MLLVSVAPLIYALLDVRIAASLRADSPRAAIRLLDINDKKSPSKPDVAEAGASIRKLLAQDDISAADAILAAYDQDHRASATAPGSEGLGGGSTATAWAQQQEGEPLADAVRTLCVAADERMGRVMLGICAEDAGEGVVALKSWVANLSLPRGVLHGMDKDGEPLDMSTFGGVYIKYNSRATAKDSGGTAVLSGYAGDFRGVYLNVDLNDGLFRQYAVLPLDLFGSAPIAAPQPQASPQPPPAISVEAADQPAVPLSTEAVIMTLEPLVSALSDLGVRVEVRAVAPDRGELVLGYVGPPKPRRSIEMLLRSDFPDLETLTFVEIPQSEHTPEVVGGDEAMAPLETAMVPAVPSRFASAGARFTSRALDAAHQGDAFATLHRQGWVVLPQRMPPLDEATLHAIVHTTKFEPIFNGHAPGEAPLRFMGTNGGWQPALEKAFTTALGSAGLLACSQGTKVVNDCYALRSLACADDAHVAESLGRQPAHSDSPAAADGKPQLGELDDADVPLSVLLAIMPGTKLWIFPSGCDSPEEAFVVNLDVGQVMAWRGDLVHAGAGYALEHVRVHAYADPPARYYERPTGKTNMCPRVG